MAGTVSREHWEAEMTRRRNGSISVEVDIEQYEVVRQLSDATLLEEMKDRGLTVLGAACDAPESWRDFADDLRAAVVGGERLHLEVLIVRMLAMAGVPRMVIPKKEPTKA